MLYAKTPIGRIQIPELEEKKLINISDEELIQKAIEENKSICVSPATFAMIEKRGLERLLQHRINPHVGMNHLTLNMVNNW